MRRSLVFPREVLLVEIERHCAEASCNARARIGLTKAEARLYSGFECEACERWHADGLAERDIPDWWEELTVTGLATLREEKLSTGDEQAATTSGVVARLSDAWRREGQGAGQADDRGAAGAARREGQGTGQAAGQELSEELSEESDAGDDPV